MLEEPRDKMLERKKDLAGMRLLLHKIFNHQNDPGKSTTVPKVCIQVSTPSKTPPSSFLPTSC